MQEALKLRLCVFGRCNFACEDMRMDTVGFVNKTLVENRVILEGPGVIGACHVLFSMAIDISSTVYELEFDFEAVELDRPMCYSKCISQHQETFHTMIHECARIINICVKRIVDVPYFEILPSQGFRARLMSEIPLIKAMVDRLRCARVNIIRLWSGAVEEVNRLLIALITGETEEGVTKDEYRRDVVKLAKENPGDIGLLGQGVVMKLIERLLRRIAQFYHDITDCILEEFPIVNTLPSIRLRLISDLLSLSEECYIFY